jgi:8-oxo-dGTP pyrophosphatase MutT (NUDIX family)
MSTTVGISSVDALDLGYAERPWAFASSRAADIAAHWQRRLAANPALFNGPVLLLRAAGITIAADGRRVFSGTFFPTDYRAFLAFRDFGFPDPQVRNGFAMAALRTCDGAFLVGEMAGHTAIAGQVQFPAGTPDPKDIRRGRGGAFVDLEASALRELAEETGLKPEQMTVAPGWTVVTEGARLAFMKELRSAAAAPVVHKQVTAFLAADPQPELCAVHCVQGPHDIGGMNLPGFMRAYLMAQWGA